MARVFDGEALAKKKEGELKTKIERLKKQGKGAKLAVIVFSDDAAGKLYSALKQAASERVGIEFEEFNFSDIDLEPVIKLIGRLNRDPKVTGIMIQRPGVSWGKSRGMDRVGFEAWWVQLVKTIVPGKDVDGLRQGSRFVPATVKAVEAILNSLPSRDGKVVVVGSLGLVGRALVKKLGATGVDIETKDLGAITLEADVLISAAGQPNLITVEMVKDGAVVIDVGWPKGDVDFEAVKRQAAVITPVPGGVGPGTVVGLLENLVEAGYSN